ncbi:uncharacterized protein LOC108327317 [Vigna angularis]|uniref:uncharacterized protein LOC108327317 n=1 Tax=Phaseolus angularis TaxID=3914 RepID=UPI000809C41F|nr:uncharacterized protein LOC108327317 [Vigna angularis]
MTLKMTYEIWKFLKEEYEGSERIKGMQALNLIRELEMQRMKDSETIKDYANKLLGIANKIRLLGTDISDSRIVQQILVTILERYEATLTSLKNSKDLSTITLAKLLTTLQAPKQRRLMREEGHIEGVLVAKFMKNKGHVEKIYKSSKTQENVQALIEEDEEEDLFVVSCFATARSTESWLIDSGCTNHMINDQELFKYLDATYNTNVRIGNRAKITVKGKGTIAIKGCTGLKLITNVLYVLKIDQNLLSVGQLLEKDYKVLFEDKTCMIKDSDNKELFRVRMKGRALL